MTQITFTIQSIFKHQQKFILYMYDTKEFNFTNTRMIRTKTTQTSIWEIKTKILKLSFVSRIRFKHTCVLKHD